MDEGGGMRGVECGEWDEGRWDEGRWDEGGEMG